ncbi:beta-1,6-N-acetylglucosaminyltransferase [Paenibacillus sp. FSL R5-0345]|uniref:beta-1,6-N-acetylglucosaminyltransferase n=1 Tax=Paenibacillus sp. FSL R5-0345 TaxID=1536770 RepID=UPI0018CE684F|nr:beta-1,6-N-acetylglucosaminyltransferase [Paenibacillus sp. FSL R5-0345]
MESFKMAYVILCHKNSEQINMLIDSLTSESVEFFLHVDQKSDIEADITHRDDIHFVEDPIDVQWGHYSQIECILKCFALIKQHGKFSYIHIISGQDMPLASNEVILEFFKENQGDEFVKYLQLPNVSETWGCYERVSVYYPRFLISRTRRMAAIRMRYIKLVMSVPFLQRRLDALPKALYKGSNWMSITGECMEYIMEFISTTPEYVRFFKNSLCGDEIFFHTIILNSTFKSNVRSEIKRYTDWETGPDYPRTLTLEDYERITRTAGTECFWGRKFDLDIDRAIVQNLLNINSKIKIS